MSGWRDAVVSPLVRCAALFGTAAVLIVVGGCASDSDPPPLVRPPQPVQAAQPGEVDARARAKAHTELASSYYEIGNMGVALEEARIAIEADPAYAPGHNIMGLVMLELRDPRQAQASFERALRLDPQDPDVNHNYGWFLCQTGRERQSVKSFMAAIQNPLYQAPAKSYTAAASCMQKAGDEPEAVKLYERALQLDRNHLPALLGLSRLRYVQGDLDGARGLLARAHASAEPSADSLWLALRIERKRGDTVAAESFGAQLKRRFPGSREFDAYQRGQFD